MKIKTKNLPIEKVNALPYRKHKKPKKQWFLLRKLLKILSIKDLKNTNFSYTMIDMEKLGKNEPSLILMNHSSFIDLKIASTIFNDRPFNIVCTSDGFIGKEWLMYNLGCIPTNKFVTDATLIKDMIYCFKNLKSSVLMFPEASYSFDGTATPLPQIMGRLLKLLKVPLVMIKTYGAFSRDPLYNNLQLRKVNVSCEVKYVLSPKDIEEKSVTQLDDIVKELFTFDSFKWQQENNIIINEHFRADCLNRVLYKCPHCQKEGSLLGKGITIKCLNCNNEYELTETGYLKNLTNETIFNHIPDWFKWERECVKNDILNENYSLELPVDIGIMKNTKCIYMIGEGTLTHNLEGFTLTSCDNKLNYKQSSTSSYSLYSDYYWYEIGDVICIGTNKELYYCFPKNYGDIVAKTRLATEEMFKLFSKK
ncbi:MAG: 1-acyl-sn-glycerol-3-phosphate acyltransferase [Clostridia bacterium]|nr:1-acyl-sn-glycerol-3-phosphate acyltransferase [Clostridia bacterium]